MHLNPYGESVVLLAADLTNDPPQGPEALMQRCAQAGLLLDRPAAAADLAPVRTLLADWAAIVDADGDERRAVLLNRLLARSAGYPRLTNHAGDGWHLHYRDDDQTAAGALEVLISVGTALHLVGRGMHRLGRCAAGDCDRVYADVTRNGTQRYCRHVCANRDAVRRHRARTTR